MPEARFEILFTTLKQSQHPTIFSSNLVPKKYLKFEQLNPSLNVNVLQWLVFCFTTFRQTMQEFAVIPQLVQDIPPRPPSFVDQMAITTTTTSTAISSSKPVHLVYR